MYDYCQKNFNEAKGDLATVFLEKMLKSNTPGGTSCSVILQNWLFLTTYKKYREKLLKNETFNIIAFQTPMWDFNVMLITISHLRINEKHSFSGLDVSNASSSVAKENAIKTAEVKRIKQRDQLGNPDSRVIIDQGMGGTLLCTYSDSYWGLGSGDYYHYGRFFWEIHFPNKLWIYQMSTVSETNLFRGREHILFWEEGKGDLVKEPGAYLRGLNIWGEKGVLIAQTGKLQATIYTGECWDSNCAPIIPRDTNHLTAIWCFCSSEHFNTEVRKVDQKLNVTNATLVKVPFDVEYWQKVAEEKYPNGLPKPYSEDPTQWLFHGQPLKSDQPLQVALSRLLGYRWPAEYDSEM